MARDIKTVIILGMSNLSLSDPSAAPVQACSRVPPRKAVNLELLAVTASSLLSPGTFSAGSGRVRRNVQPDRADEPDQTDKGEY